MLDKYIQIKDRQIICGQTSSGVWYCKELPADDTKQLDQLIGDINKIMNKYNNGKTKIQMKKPDVKGLQ